MRNENSLYTRIESFDRALTADDLAEVLSVSRATVHRLCERRVIPHFKIGKLTRFLPSAIVTWMEERQRVYRLDELLREEAAGEKRKRGRLAA
ncbi:MAG: helix-turn-helix domain-containing protein [Terriglobales bacterium]